MNPIRIRLRYADLDTFVERFAPNVTRGGVFLASRNIQAVGSVIPFEVQLRGGEVMLAGEGRVTWVKQFNPAEPHRPYGMGVQFVSVEAACRPILARILRAKELNGRGRRATTGPLMPVGGSVSGATYVSGQPGMGMMNGKAAAPLDTSVDLAAEYGLDDQAVRRMIERTWMTGARTSDDLADLLRPEPPETVTLQQALAELPRLLDPQYSRRRASSAFRPLDARATGSGAVVASPSLREASGGAAPETTAVERPPISEQPTVLSAGRPAVEAVDSGDDGSTGDGSINVRTSDLSDTTDMTGDRDTVVVMQAVPAEEISAMAGSNGRRGKRGR